MGKQNLLDSVVAYKYFLLTDTISNFKVKVDLRILYKLTTIYVGIAVAMLYLPHTKHDIPLRQF
jgi:hypothetical protein